jgi:cytochrome b561
MKFVLPSRENSAPPRHPRLTIGLHWLSAVAVLAAFAVAWTRAGFDDPGPRAALLFAHQCAGLLVLALLLARVGTRIATWSARPRHDLPGPVRFVALGSHLVMYGALLAMPLLGWALTNAHGHDVRLAGLWALPRLASADPDVADTLDSWHVDLSWMLLSLVALHALAALFHHFVRRDDVLRSMLPGAPPQAHGRARMRHPPVVPQDSRSW